MRSMQRITLFVLMAVADVAVTLAVSPVFAWAWPVESVPEVLLGFQEPYGASGRTIVHRGVDLAASPGEQVTSPVSGTVCFAGSIPATDTSEGSTMDGVSIALDDGRRLTLMPISDISVKVGEPVEEGAALGVVAPGGDRSFPSSHLHVGLKQGHTYYDPLELLGPVDGAGDAHGHDSAASATLAAGPVAAAPAAGAVPGLSSDAGAPESGSLPDAGSTEASFTVLGTVTSGEAAASFPALLSKGVMVDDEGAPVGDRDALDSPVRWALDILAAEIDSVAADVEDLVGDVVTSLSDGVTTQGMGWHLIPAILLLGFSGAAGFLVHRKVGKRFRKEGVVADGVRVERKRPDERKTRRGGIGRGGGCLKRRTCPETGEVLSRDGVALGVDRRERMTLHA